MRNLPLAVAVITLLVSVAALLGLSHPGWPGVAPLSPALLGVVVIGAAAVSLLRFPLVTEGRTASFYLVGAVLGVVWIMWGSPAGLWVLLGATLAQVGRRRLGRRTAPQDLGAYLQSVNDVVFAGVLLATVVAWWGPDRGVAAGLPLAASMILLANAGSLGLLLVHMPADQRAALIGRRTFWREAILPSLSLDFMALVILLATVHWLGLVGFFVGGGVLWWMAARLRTTLVAAEQRVQLAHAQQAAQHDTLTGLANRAGLLAYANQITQAGLPCVVAMVDVDHFKAVNDTYGHAAGDAVLTTVAHRLEGACRSHRAEWPDLVGRWGGEEFVLLLPRLPEAVAPGRVEAMRGAISATPVPWEGHAIAVTASVGATLCLDSPLDLFRAVEQADGALYAAKEDGRDRTVWTAWPVVGA